MSYHDIKQGFHRTAIRCTPRRRPGAPRFVAIILGLMGLTGGCSQSLLSPLSAPGSVRLDPAAVSEFDQVMNLALQGNMKPPSVHFRRIPVGALPAEEEVTLRRVLAQFDGTAPKALEPDLDEAGAQLAPASQK
jgi:hypothetical protein